MLQRTTWQAERACLARAVRFGLTGEAERARRSMRALRAEDRIRQILAEDPPLSREQRSDLAAAILDEGGPA